MQRNIQKKLVALLLAFLVIIPIFGPVHHTYAAVDALGNVLSTSVNGNVLVLTIDNGLEPNDDLLTIEVCRSNILRVDYQPNSVAVSDDTPMIDPNLTWGSVNTNIDVSGDPIIITSAGMRIEIAREPCRMTVKKADGTTLFWEPASGGVFSDGVRFVRAESSNMYGIHSFDCFSDNGNLLRNDNQSTASAGQQGNSGGPFMWSTAGYGLLIDSDGGYPYTNSTNRKMEFYYGGTPTEGRRYAKNDIEYYIMLGTPKEIMAGYAKITGTSPMMPKWSLGFSNFEWNIDENELVEMVDLYRAKEIPLDAYAFDYDWKRYGEDNYGEFTWNTAKFPSAATTALKQSLLNKGIKLIGITKPRIVTELQSGVSTVQGQYAEASGFYYPGHSAYTDYFLPVKVRSIDFYQQAVRNWWWQQSQDAFDKGIVGWWNDETDKVSSNNADYWFGNFETLGISQAIYEGQRAYTNDSVRVWQTARNFYPGTQRYATSIWSGDVATQFYKGQRVNWAAGLNEQKSILLSTVNNGQVKWGTDGGGFNQNSGNIENPSPELYTRWLQFASVTPVFRVHGTNYHQRQPWYFGATAEEVVKATIRQRYALIPYMYSYEYEASQTGLGLVRPLIFDYPDDQNVADYSDAWMFGDWLLVAPVTEEGQSCKWIYLPTGTWTDYNRGTVYTGGQYIPYSLDSESWSDLPMFIKAGAIIPTQEVQDYVGQSAVNYVTVDIFPSTQTTSFRYYDDDGESYDYEDGEYFEQYISAIRSGDNSAITLSQKAGNYVPALNYYLLAVHGQAAESISSSLTWYDNYTALRLASGEGWSKGRDIYGDVTYVKIAAGSASARTITLTGNDPISATTQRFEAEDAALSGANTSGKAEINNNHNGYSGAGFVDHLENDDAAVTFYVKVSNAGDYNVKLRYANGNSNVRSLSAYVNGRYVKSVALTQSGSWDTWADKSLTLHLSAGNNSITFKYDTDAGDTGFVNLDYLEIPFAPDAITVEAEESALYGSAAVNQDHWYYSGSGFLDSLTTEGAAVEFLVDVPSSTQYTVIFRFCNGTQSDKTLDLYVNNVYTETLVFPSEGGNWNNWQELQQAVSLNAGSNKIAIRYNPGNSGNINLDRITIPLVAPAQAVALLDNGGFERTRDSSAWTEWHPYGQDCAYGIDSGSGTNPPESPCTGNNRAYFYSGNAYQQSIHNGVSLENGTYCVRAWIKVSNASPSVGRMEISGYGGSDIYVNMPLSGSNWKLIMADDIIVTTGYLDVGFYCVSAGGTTIHIDEVSVIKK